MFQYVISNDCMSILNTIWLKKIDDNCFDKRKMENN